MTYCVAMSLNQGLLFMSDSRTNAGVDHVSTFCKMTVFEKTGERVLVLLNAGNLATTQTVVNILRKSIENDDTHLMNTTSMFDAAGLLGEAIRSTIDYVEKTQLTQGSVDFRCTFLIGGQIKGEEPRLFLVYPQGNFIETTSDTAYFQIGESKYGKPIIDRVVTPETEFDDAVKCALVSFDSTIKSNLSVGLPIDLALVEKDKFGLKLKHRFDADDAYLKTVRIGWGQGLHRVFEELPAPEWLSAGGAVQ
jgi:putative proteasome-type protease